MRRVFTGLAILLLVIVVAQFYFAASGAFAAGPGDESFRAHDALGWVIFFLPVVMAVVAALARLPWRLVGMAALVAGLTSLQVLIAVVARGVGDGTTAGQLIFGLHAVSGLAILAVAVLIVWRARASAPR